MATESVYNLVRDSYGKIAEQASLQGDSVEKDKIAQAFGYSVEDLQSLPIGTNLGVSCGNPLATARLRNVCVINHSAPVYHLF
jgi:arsenite methyltransferase